MNNDDMMAILNILFRNFEISRKKTKDVALSYDQTVLIEAKTDVAKDLLGMFANRKTKLSNKLKYKQKNKVTVSSYILKEQIDLLQASDKDITITIGKDQPLKLENKHFCIFVAPKEKDIL